MALVKVSDKSVRSSRATGFSIKTYSRDAGDVMKKTRSSRSSRGNVLTIFVCIFAALVTTSLIAARVVMVNIASHREMTAVEGAALVAARDLALIVIDDPNYGFISLCDYAPVGHATAAADQQPLPVTGINQIVANARMQMIVAQQLNNPELLRLAQQDAVHAREATTRLNDALCRSLRSAGPPLRDMHGNPVNTLRDVRKELLDGLHGLGTFCQPRVSSISLSLGWIDDAIPSGAKVPLPIDDSSVPPTLRHRDQYNAFVDVPCGGEHYYFAAVDEQEQLLSVSKFAPFDGKRACSVVCVTATIDQVGLSADKTDSRLSLSACAAPGGMPAIDPTAVFALQHPNGMPNGIACLTDVLSSTKLYSHPIDVYTAFGGDYPNDPGAKLQKDSQYPNGEQLRAVLADAFHDWLRTVRVRPRIDSLMAALNTKIDRDGSKPCILYEFNQDGYVLTRCLSDTPFSSQSVLENQRYILTYDGIADGASIWAVSLRDEVSNLGIIRGGKHAGQSLPADAVNWCDLQVYGAQMIDPAAAGKGREVVGLTPHGTVLQGGQAIATDGVYFTSPEGLDVSLQPRSTYYAGGEAVVLEISSPRAIGSQNPDLSAQH